MQAKLQWAAAGIAIGVTAAAATAAEVVVGGVPSYEWHYGCGPTAGGMVIGYWDAHGYPDLIEGSNDWTTNRTGVQAMIASAGHIEDYWPTPDREPPPPLHADDCLADFMRCSQDPRGQGQSFENQQYTGLVGYAQYCGYGDAVGGWQYFGGLWDRLVTEIDADRPMELYVDKNGDAAGDHFVTAIGYRCEGDPAAPTAPEYAYYNTYDHNVHWSGFVSTSAEQPYAVGSGSWFDPYDARPVADANGPYVLDLAVASTVHLDGSGSTDADGTVTAWDWDLNGDGWADVAGEAAEVPAFLLDMLGWQTGEERPITLSVTDEQGGVSDQVDMTTLLYLPASRTPGDADLDGAVGQADLDVLLGNFGAAGELNWLDGDFDGDAAVSDRDLSLLLAHWSGAQAPDVPAPGALGLLAVSGAMVAAWRPGRRGRRESAPQTRAAGGGDPAASP